MAQPQVAGDDQRRLVDIRLLIERREQAVTQLVGFSRKSVELSRLVCQARGGHVEEPVHVDGERCMQNSTNDAGGRIALDRLMHGIGKNERVPGVEPVGDFVVVREPGQPDGRRTGHMFRQLVGPHAGPQFLLQDVDDGQRLFTQQHRREVAGVGA